MTKYYKKILIVFLILACFTLLVACKNEIEVKDVKQKGNYKIYYPNEKETSILYDYIKIETDDIDLIINELILKLKEGNYNKAKKAVIPADVEYATYTLEANILTITFDENYLKIKGVSEVLKRASIVYTLIQMDVVDYVRIQVNGKALVIDGDEIGDMSEHTFRDIIGEDSDIVVKDKIKMYYSDSSGKKLRALVSGVESDGTIMKEEVIIKKLINGPLGADKIGYYGTINPNTKVNRVSLNDKVCYIDFDEAFLERHNGVSEEVVIYSIVNTLTELNTVNQVRITINGKVREVFNEYANLGGFIERNYDIISYEE